MTNTQARPSNTQLPVTIVSGFLGSGKTTLLNRILNGQHGLKIAVMVNDFGAINIDSQLVVSATQKTINLANGCICCTVENDLIEQLQKLLRLREGRPEHILIETSGVSDPGKVINTLRYPVFRQQLNIETVITLVDAEQFLSLEGERKSLAMGQLSVADLVVLNKVDLVAESQLEQLREQWLFPSARVIETQFAEVPLALLFGGGHGAAPTTTPAPAPKPNAADDAEHPCSKQCEHTRPHDQLFTSVSWQSQQPLSLVELRQTLKQLPNNVYRAKGFVCLQEVPDERCLVQLVGSRLSIEKAGREGQAAGSQLVFIGWRDMDQTQLLKQLDLCVIQAPD